LLKSNQYGVCPEKCDEDRKQDQADDDAGSIQMEAAFFVLFGGFLIVAFFGCFVASAEVA
jgi:hypothetical protein